MRAAACTVFALAVACAGGVSAEPFEFRGELDDAGARAHGTYALRLTLYASEDATQPLAAPLELFEVVVTDGRFAADVDIAGLPAHLDAGWLEVAVKPGGDSGDYVTLEGRSRVALKGAQLCPASWALAGNADTNAAVDFLGTTTAQALEMRSNNLRVARLDSQPVAGGSTATVLFGSPANTIAAGAHGAAIGGGGSPPGVESSIVVGPNAISSPYATIGGGTRNSAGNAALDGRFATVAGGVDNRATGTGAVVGGGTLNKATSLYGAVLGGGNNSASGTSAMVGGGTGNEARGSDSVVTGGASNCAGGATSWAGGNGAKVRPGSTSTTAGCFGVALSGDANGDEGSFVWADSQGVSLVTTGPDQFRVRARGGARFSNDTEFYFGNDARQMLNLFDQSYGIGIQSGTQYFRSATRFAWFADGVHSDTANDPGAGGSLLMTLDTGVLGTPVGTARAQTFTSVSSRDVKTAFEAIDPSQVLARVLALPVSEWSYRNATDARHIGPMSQDFHAAFGLNGNDDEAIATVDADGVALAAIQGLNAKLEARAAALEAELAALRGEIARLRAGPGR